MKTGSDLKQFFEGMGFRVDWDFSWKLGETWYEIFDRESGEMILQIDSSVTLKRFKEEWVDGPSNGDPPFFIASELPNEDWENLAGRIKKEAANQ